MISSKNKNKLKKLSAFKKKQQSINQQNHSKIQTDQKNQNQLIKNIENKQENKDKIYYNRPIRNSINIFSLENIHQFIQKNQILNKNIPNKNNQQNLYRSSNNNLNEENNQESSKSFINQQKKNLNLIQIKPIYDIIKQQKKKNINSHGFSSFPPTITQILPLIIILYLIIEIIIISLKVYTYSYQKWITLSVLVVLTIPLIYLWYLTSSIDPTDTVQLAHREYIFNPTSILFSPENHRYFCNLCKTCTSNKSFHCNKCNRCVQYFDHHCKWLNNCIGAKNYFQFFQLILLAETFIIYFFIVNGVFLSQILNDNKRDIIQQIDFLWYIGISLVIALAPLVSVSMLVGLHIYLVIAKRSTIELILQNRRKSKIYPANSNLSDKKQNKIYALKLSNQSPVNSPPNILFNKSPNQSKNSLIIQQNDQKLKIFQKNLINKLRNSKINITQQLELHYSQFDQSVNNLQYKQTNNQQLKLFYQTKSKESTLNSINQNVKINFQVNKKQQLNFEQKKNNNADNTQNIEFENNIQHKNQKQIEKQSQVSQQSYKITQKNDKNTNNQYQDQNLLKQMSINTQDICSINQKNIKRIKKQNKPNGKQNINVQKQNITSSLEIEIKIPMRQKQGVSSFHCQNTNQPNQNKQKQLQIQGQIQILPQKKFQQSLKKLNIQKNNQNIQCKNQKVFIFHNQNQANNIQCYEDSKLKLIQESNTHQIKIFPKIYQIQVIDSEI